MRCVGAGCWLSVAALASCGPSVAADASATSSTSTSSSTTTSSTAASGDPETSTSTSTSETSTTVSDETDGCPFVCPGDTDDPGLECSQWEQDCPAGQKCTVWATDGDTWNAYKCVPIAEDPKGVGEACTVEGSAVSGIDDCELGAMCFDVDPETNEGTCYAFCIGSESNAVCVDASSRCNISDSSALALCIPMCGPLLQDCPEGEACYPIPDAFVCAPDASGPDAGLYGDVCEFLNVCDPGLFCDELGGVPDCASSFGCCNAYCDLEAADPDASCPDAAQGQTCIPWYEPGEAPPGLATVGRCALP
jgi:hypothetical protein